MTRLEDLPLRPRKQAQTRLALMNAVLARLDGTRTLEEIHVRELCAEASISEASFFNYFPKKTDLLVYFIRLWSLELAWRIRHELADAPSYEAVEAILTSTAREVRAHPGVMAEIIAFQARETPAPDAMALELADRLAAYPDRPGIEDVPAVGLEGLLPPLVERAIERGELPGSTDRTAALLALASVFFGVPLLLHGQPALIEGAYRQQLAVVWAGLAAAPPRLPHSPRPPRPPRPPRVRSPRPVRSPRSRARGGKS